MMVKAPRRALTALALLAAIGCGDDGSSEPEGSISVSASPTSLSLPQGGTGTVTVTLTRGGGFEEEVTVTVEGVPAGVTASVSPASLTGTTTQATVTVNVASTVAAGSYPMTVRASAAGIGAATTQYTLVVTAVPTGSYTLTATAASAAPGGTGTSTIGIQRTNFTGNVALTLDNPPTGITGTFNPASTAGVNSVLTINVAGTVAPGNHTLTIKGTATGIADKTATFALTVSAAGNFTISASPATMTIAPGASQVSTITIVRTNLTADIALSLVSPPTGITGTFTPSTLTGSALTSSVQVSVAGTVAPGTHTLTVQGVAGSVTQATTIALTVAAASSVTLSMQPTSLNIQQGSSGNATLNLNRVNFTGNVTPSVTGAPAGMAVTFNPNPITANSAQVTVNVGASTAIGTHNLTITGAAGAAGNPTTTLAVAVTAATGGSSFNWDFCTVDGVPLKFWRLSGTTWVEVTPTVVGGVTRFSFSITSTSGGVAFTMQASALASRVSDGPSKMAAIISTTKKVREKTQSALRLANETLPQATNFFDTVVQLALTSELGSYAELCGSPPSTPASKTFNVTGLGAAEIGLLGYGPGSAGLSPSTTTYNLSVEPGTYDWAALFGPAPATPDFITSYTAYRNGRGETVPGATVSVNRTGATAFATVPFTVSGGGAASLNLFSETIEGARGAIIGFSLGSPFSSTNSGNMLFFAPADRLATDLTSFSVLNGEQVGTALDLRSTTRYYGAPPASATFTLPGAIPAFTVSQVNGAPVTSWSATGPIPAEYQTSVTPVVVTFEGNGGNALVTIAATRAWLLANGMSTTYTLTQPTLPNFLSQWAAASPLASTTVIMLGYDELAVPTAGSVINFAGRIQSP